jgi:tRNA G37 N-methylase Trm5
LSNGIILDPFAGSAISAFEAVKSGRKAVAFDINPLTAFLIEVFSTQFNKPYFKKAVSGIVDKIEQNYI